MNQAKSTYNALLLITSLLFFNSIQPQTIPDKVNLSENYHLHAVFSHPHLRLKFSGFLTEVLRQVPVEKFYKLIDSLITQEKQDDIFIYQKLLEKISSVLPYFQPYKKIQALKNQKKELSRQALTLLSEPSITNCLEIGTPGTYASAISAHIPITGTLYVMNEKKQLTDSIQAPSYNPLKGFTAYDVFLPLNNYEPISDKIPDKSLDLVMCFIGLHHIPREKIEPFIASIHRILRPGGVFLLREHDCYNAEMESIISCAHSVFNIVMNQDPLEIEQTEFRNFQKLNYWIELLEKNGFEADQRRLLQQGDPTLNTMIKFFKKPITHEETLAAISHDLQTNKEYTFDLLQTYLTAPEWFNVDASQHYGAFIEHTPFYDFPYLSYISTYWKIFKHSWNIAQRKQGTRALITSSHTLMSLFVGAFMTLEYGAKALISWPIRTWYNGEKPLPIKIVVHDPLHEIDTLDDRIKIIEQYQNSFTLIELPRNKEFLQTIEKINATTITIHEIAGQKEILIKALLSSNAKVQDTFEGCKQEYTWQIPTMPQHTFAAFTVHVSHLKQVCNTLQQQGIRILHIHDF